MRRARVHLVRYLLLQPDTGSGCRAWAALITVVIGALAAGTSI
jgi:hypothetical protein